MKYYITKDGKFLYKQTEDELSFYYMGHWVRRDPRILKIYDYKFKEISVDDAILEMI